MDYWVIQPTISRQRLQESSLTGRRKGTSGTFSVYFCILRHT